MARHRRLHFDASMRDNLPQGVCWVGDASAFANPFRVATPGEPASHAEAAGAYLRWLLEPGRAALRARASRELRGLDLACDCPADLPCHGDVLLELVNEDEAEGREID